MLLYPTQRGTIIKCLHPIYYSDDDNTLTIFTSEN